MGKLTVYVDGACSGNPGPAGFGCVINDKSGRKLKEISKCIGNATNNIAEYSAIISGLEEALGLKADEVEIFSDSELVVKQIKGEYKVNDSDLKKLRNKVYSLLMNFNKWSFSRVSREKNADADKLAKKSVECR